MILTIGPQYIINVLYALIYKQKPNMKKKLRYCWGAFIKHDVKYTGCVCVCGGGGVLRSNVSPEITCMTPTHP